MMQCLCVCLSRKMITSQLSARGAKRDARQALPAVGRLWPSDDDGDDADDDDDNDEDDGNVISGWIMDQTEGSSNGHDYLQHATGCC